MAEASPPREDRPRGQRPRRPRGGAPRGAPPPPGLDPADVRARLAAVTLSDEHRLARRLEALLRRRPAPPDRAGAGAARLLDDLARAEARARRRRAAVPAVAYPAHLPVAQRRDEIAAALRSSQVVVVAGATGSGKTTQLPKILLEMGRGVRGTIGHTQPRRLAARTVAERVASELGVELGGAVGYQVRFADRTGDATLVKLMTDGILLAEIPDDRMLLRYDTLVVDEAHERSLTIDFLLGYLATLLPRRPDLQVVVTSATIATERFSQHFGGAPVVEVSGRTYPVEIRYRPLVAGAGSLDPDDLDGPGGGEAGRPEGPGGGGAGPPAPRAARPPRRPAPAPAPRPEEPRDQVQAVCDAVRELLREPPGDVLVFLSGEREIRDTADALGALGLPGTEVLPLYGRLSAREQHRVFEPHAGRRVVLATNVAETSLTVPGVRYVVDPGTARVSRFSRRLKVQRLPIEPVSRASADQRAGRCGRVAPGVCIRLYAEADYLARPAYTEPEILRTSLAAVVLRMAALDLGDVAAFPFLDPPDSRQVRDAVALLAELGALVPADRDRPALTPLGRRLARLPVDPRLGRMLLAAGEEGCVGEVLVLVAALSIQDPRERPADAQGAADAAHARFAEPGSDFLGLLRLWEHLRERQRELSSGRFRRLCSDSYLNYLRVREWQDLHAQLREAADGLGLRPAPAPAGPDQVHRALLAGLLSHVGLRDPQRRDYLGARGARFALWPGSVLARRPPELVVVAELVETGRLWGRTAARVEPEWAERAAGDLVVRTRSEPRWSARRGEAVATERVTLYGVPLVAGREVGYAAVDPAAARELFLRHALVDGEWTSRHRFWDDNRRRLAEVAELEERSRRRDLVADDDTLLGFYGRHVPASVVSVAHFDTWWRQQRRATPHLLDLPEELLRDPRGRAVAEEDFPGRWRVGPLDGDDAGDAAGDAAGPDGALELPVLYRFSPGDPEDGATVEVPVAVLNRLPPGAFDWQVPGFREELVAALLRTLPRPLRRRLPPAADLARELAGAVGPADGPPARALARAVSHRTGVGVAEGDLDLGAVPGHLRVTVRVVGPDGAVLARGHDVRALRESLAPRTRRAVAAAAARALPRGSERRGLRDFPAEGLPARVEEATPDGVVVGYPALVDTGDSVDLRVLESRAAADAATPAGLRRLLLLSVPVAVRPALAALPADQRLALAAAPHPGGVPALLADCVTAALDAVLDGSAADRGGPPRDPAAWAELVASCRGRVPGDLVGLVRGAARVLAARVDVERALGRVPGTDLAALAAADVRAQVGALVGPGFVAASGPHLGDVPRYLAAAAVRLERLPERPGRDAAAAAVVAALDADRRRLLRAVPPDRPVPAPLAQSRWMLEELRVGLFAQPMRTAGPVSEVRVRRLLAAAAAEVAATP